MSFHEVYCSDICMYFAHKKALDGATILFKTGSIHALLGENGAGKSTLAYIISGLAEQTSGKLTFDGEPLFSAAGCKNNNKVRIVQQRPKLAENLAVWQNALIATQKKSLKPFSKKRICSELNAICSEWNFDLDILKKVKNLNDAERLFAAMICVLADKPAFIILDEPTAVLDSKQRQNFFVSLQKAKQNGLGIIYISHNIEETVQLCDTISVLKKGRCTKTFDNSKYDTVADEILKEMFSSDFSKNEFEKNTVKVQQNKSFKNMQKIVFRAKNINAVSDNIKLKDISFDLYAGTITIIKGERKAGLEILENILTGINSPYFSGEIELDGKILKKITPSLLRSCRTGIVSSNKYFISSNPNLLVKEMLLPFMQNKGKDAVKKNLQQVDELIKNEKVDISKDEPVSNLSGGMLQRLILAREILTNPILLILAEPVHGLDLKTILYFEEQLKKTAEKGAAILLLTSDVDDGLSDYDFLYELKNGTLEKRQPL